jgi:hypothetical protein
MIIGSDLSEAVVVKVKEFFQLEKKVPAATPWLVFLNTGKLVNNTRHANVMSKYYCHAII